MSCCLYRFMLVERPIVCVLASTVDDFMYLETRRFSAFKDVLCNLCFIFHKVSFI